MVRSFPFPLSGARTSAGKQPIQNIPGSARCGHDKQQESTGSNPPSGHENPELSRLVLFTPSNTEDQTGSMGVEW